jgi:hypothetical protein
VVPANMMQATAINSFSTKRLNLLQLSTFAPTSLSKKSLYFVEFWLFEKPKGIEHGGPSQN